MANLADVGFSRAEAYPQQHMYESNIQKKRISDVITVWGMIKFTKKFSESIKNFTYMSDIEIA